MIIYSRVFAFVELEGVVIDISRFVPLGQRALTRERIPKVELEGVEPSSKQGNHTLSTCLFQTSFSCYDKTWTTNHNLIL